MVVTDDYNPWTDNHLASSDCCQSCKTHAGGERARTDCYTAVAVVVVGTPGGAQRDFDIAVVADLNKSILVVVIAENVYCWKRAPDSCSGLYLSDLDYVVTAAVAAAVVVAADSDC